jgi:hypothetical protein
MGYTESEREVKRKAVQIFEEENGCMDHERVVSGNDFYDCGERRRATRRKLLQLELSKRRVHSAAGSVHKVFPDVHHNPGNSAFIFS